MCDNIMQQITYKPYHYTSLMWFLIYFYTRNSSFSNGYTFMSIQLFFGQAHWLFVFPLQLTYYV